MSYDCIVSLTTWKKRIGSPELPKVLYRLLRQKTKYNYKVVLVLAEDEFPQKEAVVPKVLLAMAKKEPRFEIVWQKSNTRALKKLTGAQMAYPNLPIITTDDDILVKDSFVEEFMNCHVKHPKDIITAHIWKHETGVEVTGWARLYPPRSLALLPDTLFMKFFKGLEDDIWNGLRAYLVGTKHRLLGTWPFEAELKVGSALRDEYLKTDVTAMMANFAKGWKLSV